MKIGILTFHDGINHGAYLQTYSLYNTLKKMGHDVKIINYKNIKHWFREYMCFIIIKHPSSLVDNLKKIHKFRHTQRQLSMTDFTFLHKNVHKEQFDTVVIGSDEVWNFNNPFVGFDSIYFGYHLNAKNIISYAASFGAISPEQSIPIKVVKGLKRLNAISVRDENSKIIAQKITGKSAELVLDPTFLYDFKNEAKMCPHKNFILIYTPEFKDETIAKIKAFAKQENKILISVAYYNPWCDINVIPLDAFEWLGYFKAADMVITSMFHGTMFSIKYNKQFCTIMVPNRVNKLRSILINLKLDGRILSPENSIGRIFETEIDYNIINQILKEKKEMSMDFLKKHIDNK